jgi:hypothetical protein
MKRLLPVKEELDKGYWMLDTGYWILDIPEFAISEAQKHPVSRVT